MIFNATSKHYCYCSTAAAAAAAAAAGSCHYKSTTAITMTMTKATVAVATTVLSVVLLLTFLRIFTQLPTAASAGDDVRVMYDSCPSLSWLVFEYPKP